MKRRSAARTVAEIVVLTVAVLTLAWLVFGRVVYVEPPAPSPPPVPVAAAPAHVDEALVVAVAGKVERVLPGGSWVSIAAGQKLRADESVRTGHGAHTDLQIGERSRITVAEASQVTIRELSEKVHRLKLNRGHIAVDYQPDGKRVLRVENESGEAVAETAGARFSMLSNGSVVAVATQAGNVGLTAHQKTVSIPAGEQAIAPAGKAPTEAAPIPARLLLKVANAATPAATLCADVTGSAPLDAEVLVDGEPAEVDAEGRFHRRVGRDPKRTAVQVSVRDAAGRETTRSVPCVAQGDPPVRDLAVRWGKAKP